METQLRMVAVGHIDTKNPLNDKIVCDPMFEDTWYDGAAKAFELCSTPIDLVENAYFMGITDRDLGLPSVAMTYSDAEQRAAYVAGKCSARRVLTAAEILAELEDLHEAMDDEDFWRLGNW
jgi:hypothetical protein